MTSSEAAYDFPTVYLEDTVIFNGKNVTSFTSFTVSNAAGKRMKIEYAKDGSVDGGNDRAYLAIPNT